MNRLRGTAYGRTFELRSDSPEVLAACMPFLPHGWRPTDRRPERMWEIWASEGQPVVWADADVLASCADVEEAAAVATGDLELWVAERARDRVFVHAGCVVHPSGALLLPGRTHSGKSTLTAALVRRGLTYYSDEFAVLDAAGQVRPYPREIRLRARPGQRGTPVPHEQSGAVVGRGRVRVAVVAHLAFEPGPALDVTPMSPGEQVLRLLDNAVAAQTRPRAVMTALAAAAAGSAGVRGSRGEAEEAADALVALLEAQVSG